MQGSVEKSHDSSCHFCTFRPTSCLEVSVYMACSPGQKLCQNFLATLHLEPKNRAQQVELVVLCLACLLGNAPHWNQQQRFCTRPDQKVVMRTSSDVHGPSFPLMGSSSHLLSLAGVHNHLHIPRKSLSVQQDSGRRLSASFRP